MVSGGWGRASRWEEGGDGERWATRGMKKRKTLCGLSLVPGTGLVREVLVVPSKLILCILTVSIILKNDYYDQ